MDLLGSCIQREFHFSGRSTRNIREIQLDVSEIYSRNTLVAIIRSRVSSIQVTLCQIFTLIQSLGRITHTLPTVVCTTFKI